VNRWLDRLEEGACVVLLAVMTGVALLNVITRYVVRYSLAFTEEVVVSLFVWLTLFGTAVAFREGAHLGFNYLVERLPRPLQRGAVWLAAALAVVLFGALICYGQRTGQSGMRQMVWGWIIAGVIFGVVFPGIDNWAHAGGFAGGWLAARLLDPLREERPGHVLAALVGLALSLAAIVVSVVTGLPLLRG